MDLTVSRESGIVQVKTTGPIDESAREAFNKHLYADLAAGGAKLILDLSDSPYVNSQGLAQLVSLVAYANTKSSRVILCSVPPHVAGVIAVTKLDKYFDRANSFRRDRPQREMTGTLGENSGGHLYTRFRGEDKAFLRFYTKFAADHSYEHHFVELGGYNPATPWPNPRAGTRPAGDERVLVFIDPIGWYGRHAPPGVWGLYTYWPDMKASADGKYWGNVLRPARPAPDSAKPLGVRGTHGPVELRAGEGGRRTRPMD
jgi:anti-anti-sigma factor